MTCHGRFAGPVNLSRNASIGGLESQLGVTPGRTQNEQNGSALLLKADMRADVRQLRLRDITGLARIPRDAADVPVRTCAGVGCKPPFC